MDSLHYNPEGDANHLRLRELLAEVNISIVEALRSGRIVRDTWRVTAARDFAQELSRWVEESPTVAFSEVCERAIPQLRAIFHGFSDADVDFTRQIEGMRFQTVLQELFSLCSHN